MTDERAQTPEEAGHELEGPTMETDPDFPAELSVVVQTDPEPLVSSPSNGSANRAGLSVLVTNVNDDEPVQAHAILVRLKVSDSGIPKEDLLSETWSKRGETLTRQPKTREANDDGSGLYTFTYSGRDRTDAFAPGETVAVFIHDIPVSAREGVTAVAIGVQEEEDGETAWKFIPLGKFPAGYYLRELRAETNPVKYGDSAVLTWLEPPIEGIQYALYANGAKVELNKDHPQPVTTPALTTDTTFELVPSWATNVRDKQRLLVRVIGGDIVAGKVAADSLSAKSSLTVREGFPLIHGKWNCLNVTQKAKRFDSQALETTGLIITNFQFVPKGTTSSRIEFYVRAPRGVKDKSYEVIFGNENDYFGGYGFAYGYAGCTLTLMSWAKGGSSPKINFSPAFAYILQ